MNVIFSFISRCMTSCQQYHRKCLLGPHTFMRVLMEILPWMTKISHVPGSTWQSQSNLDPKLWSVKLNYCDVIMDAMASQITSVSIVYLAVCSGLDQRKHQSSAWLAFVRGIHRRPVNSPHKGPVTRKMFPFDDVIMRRRHWLSKTLKTVFVHGYQGAPVLLPGFAIKW